MSSWPLYPIIYEINTWVWLQELGKSKYSLVTLASESRKALQV